MMSQIKDLQKLIEERAENNLRADLTKLGQIIREQPLLNGSHIPRLYTQYEKQIKIVNAAAPGTEKVYKDIHPGCLISIDYRGVCDRYTQLLYNHWLPIYIEREAAKFLKDIDDLKVRAGQLKSDVQNLLDNQPS